MCFTETVAVVVSITVAVAVIVAVLAGRPIAVESHVHRTR